MALLIREIGFLGSAHGLDYPLVIRHTGNNFRIVPIILKRKRTDLAYEQTNKQTNSLFQCVCVYVCVFQVSLPYLGFCPDSKHFIVNCEQNVVKFTGK